MENATFAAGCFWGVEETFRALPGVLDTAVGFMGGTTENPSYREVCGGRTGNAEVVHLQYDPSKLSYDELLNAFWGCHDPTTLNRQGPDVGSQYRSAIFFHTSAQEAAALSSKEGLEAAGRFRRPIVTAVEPASTFWRAEEYHQRYLEKRGAVACRLPGS
ncbi:MAG TPA: peptide-methionine (S)-S-oxide reductase MsrA [Gemmatimonadota bacterium]|nr:peptide-methionine (S)-S-oxide reductase MsrA [Gemmatimonadota bacterium]